MAGPVGSGSVFQFGAFELDLQARELRKRGIRVKLQDQPLQILFLLIECAGEVVTREQIQKKLWCVDTFVDFENSINGAVRRLRDALGDTSENPRFVETVARHGYRFVAPVSRHPATSRIAQDQSRERRRYMEHLCTSIRGRMETWFCDSSVVADSRRRKKLTCACGDFTPGPPLENLSPIPLFGRSLLGGLRCC
jgi:DNA-binding winged helix-turn-helix (wHTH) protein